MSLFVAIESDDCAAILLVLFASWHLCTFALKVTPIGHLNHLLTTLAIATTDIAP